MIFNRIIKKIIERKAGKFSAKISAIKGVEPIITIGSVSALIVVICRAFGIEITEQVVSEVCAGAVTIYGAIKAIANWIKNRNK